MTQSQLPRESDLRTAALLVQAEHLRDKIADAARDLANFTKELKDVMYVIDQEEDEANGYRGAS